MHRARAAVHAHVGQDVLELRRVDVPVAVSIEADEELLRAQALCSSAVPRRALPPLQRRAQLAHLPGVPLRRRRHLRRQRRPVLLGLLRQRPASPHPGVRVRLQKLFHLMQADRAVAVHVDLLEQRLDVGLVHCTILGDACAELGRVQRSVPVVVHPTEELWQVARRRQPLDQTAAEHVGAVAVLVLLFGHVQRRRLHAAPAVHRQACALAGAGELRAAEGAADLLAVLALLGRQLRPVPVEARHGQLLLDLGLRLLAHRAAGALAAQLLEVEEAGTGVVLLEHGGQVGTLQRDLEVAADLRREFVDGQPVLLVQRAAERLAAEQGRPPRVLLHLLPDGRHRQLVVAIGLGVARVVLEQEGAELLEADLAITCARHGCVSVCVCALRTAVR